MKILNHLKNVLIAVLPITIIVVIFNLGFGFDTNMKNFLLGTLALVVGETILLTAIDSSVVRMGELVSGTSNRKRGIWLILVLVFVFAILSTMAEPDMQVLAGEIALFGVRVPKILFIALVGLGVGVFCVIGILRSAAGIPIFAVMLLFYGIVFVLALFVPSNQVAVAFDSGSASTGIVAAPFLIALCSGISTKRKNGAREGNFGLIGVASIGPVLVVLAMFLLAPKGSGESAAFGLETNSLALNCLITVLLAIVPMLVIFFVFELCFARVSLRENMKILLSSVVMSIGLFLMIFGLEFGFVGVGKDLGQFLGTKNLGIVVLILGGIFGFFLAFAEPAVGVLGKQVEEATNRNIKSVLVVVAVAVSMFLGVALSVVTVLLNWNIAYVLLAVLGLSLFLMIFAPSTFIAISFDSGGVALGPTSTAFLFPMILGLASSLGSDASFGTLALLGLVPCVVLQSLGVLYALKTKQLHIVPQRLRKQKTGVVADKFSNIDDLEKQIKSKYGEAK